MYDNRIIEERPVEGVKPIDERSLSALMGAATNKAIDAFMMARKINEHLFGNSDEEATVANPSCFMEALQSHDHILLLLCEELARVAGRLGV